MKIDKQMAKKLHKEINDTMKQIAKKHGLIFQEDNTLRYGVDEARIRVIFKGEDNEYNTTTVTPEFGSDNKKSSSKLSIGDKVKISFQKRSAVYELVDFKRKNVVIRNIETGTRYRINPSNLILA